jgi:hypothetical protein
LQDGKAVPMEKFQEILRFGQGLPVILRASLTVGGTDE